MLTRSVKSEVDGKLVTPAPSRFSKLSRHRSSFAYGAVLVFCFLYFYRPEDFIPGLNVIPMAKITGLLALLGLLVEIMGRSNIKVPTAIKLLVVLLVQMFLTIPFAYWRGGAADTVINKFSKTVITAVLISLVVVSLRQLRQLLWIQASAVAVVTVASVLINHRQEGRLEGIQKGILENPNDLALNIAIVFPLCIAFMLHARGFKKLIWIVAMMFMLVAVVMTYSRGGLLALIICGGFSLYEYGIKGKRYYMVGIAATIALVGLGIVVTSSSYRARVESLVMGNIAGSHDKGSLGARKELLKKSIVLSLEHPLFGVGPGNFPVIDTTWLVAHNTYTELSAEAGIMALILFLAALRSSFKNVAEARKSEKYRTDPDYRLFTQALFAGMAAYVIGACFASTEYNLYPYVMIGYTCVLLRLGQPAVEKGKEKLIRQAAFTRSGKPHPAWGR